MKSHLWKLAALLPLVALGACGKKRNQRAEVVECSSISLDAKGTTQCLVQLYRWKVAEAQRAATARAQELDSLKAWHEDSIWALSAPKHKRDLQNCQRGSEQLRDCLLVAGWPLARVRATTDSAWNAELPKHRRELQACMSKRDVNLSSCLTLYYKWESDRALATADSVARVRLGGTTRR
ncbi:MAG TPA: hypothetical protein VGQ48_02555 [Gemmatimonadales bacterium]|jgi:hypothetical protein|nr:hypothetical protein [Gemmatimonadales bacterium]